jgi:hypothetical protein
MEPRGSLEYPNMLYAFGRSPGTTSLTWYMGMRGQPRTPVDFKRGSEAKKRKLKLITILERLNELTQEGLREVCLLESRGEAETRSIPTISITFFTTASSRIPTAHLAGRTSTSICRSSI